MKYYVKTTKEKAVRKVKINCVSSTEFKVMFDTTWPTT